jgi:hypothetical protein
MAEQNVPSNTDAATYSTTAAETPQITAPQILTANMFQNMLNVLENALGSHTHTHHDTALNACTCWNYTPCDRLVTNLTCVDCSPGNCAGQCRPCGTAQCGTYECACSDVQGWVDNTPGGNGTPCTLP